MSASTIKQIPRTNAEAKNTPRARPISRIGKAIGCVIMAVGGIIAIDGGIGIATNGHEDLSSILGIDDSAEASAPQDKGPDYLSTSTGLIIFGSGKKYFKSFGKKLP